MFAGIIKREHWPEMGQQSVYFRKLFIENLIPKLLTLRLYFQSKKLSGEKPSVEFGAVYFKLALFSKKW